MSTKTTTDTDLTDMADEIARSEVARLSREVERLRAAVDELRETPRDPNLVEHLVPRGLTEAGADLLAQHRNLSFRLARLREERRDVDERWERVNRELRRDPRATLSQEREEAYREAMAELNATLAELTDEVEVVERELDEVENELRAYVLIRTLPVRASRNVEVQA